MIKRNLLYLIVFISGFVHHKFLFEVYNYYNVLDYKECIANSQSNNKYRECKHHLEYNEIQAFFMYQPNYWDEELEK